jgi:hypothetical protein
MPLENVKDPHTFLYSLGGLHDAVVDKLNIDLVKKSVSITIDDLHSGFSDMPKHTGPKRSTLIFYDIKMIVMNINIDDEMIISSADVTKNDVDFDLVIDLRYGGVEKSGRSIVVYFRTMDIEYG